MKKFKQALLFAALTLPMAVHAQSDTGASLVTAAKAEVSGIAASVGGWGAGMFAVAAIATGIGIGVKWVKKFRGAA